MASAAAFLIRTVRDDELGRSGQAADREVLHRPLRLRAVVRVGRHLNFAERIAFDHGRPFMSASGCPARSRSETTGPCVDCNYTSHMLPAFLDSMVDLITRTSTDLPPDVRAAMGLALATEAPATRAGQALTIIAQNIDQAAVVRGADLPGHRHADVRGQGAGRRQSDLDAAADP